MPNKKLILHLSLIDGVGPTTVQNILKNSNSDLSRDLYRLSTYDWMHYFGMTEKVAEKIVTGLADQKILETELQLIEKHNIRISTIIDNDYPTLLQQIHMPPPVLYYRGGDFLSNIALAIVGSRASNTYGHKVVTTLVPDLVASGMTIVSGGALGIDALAHDITLKHGGRTIAVLGSGLLKEYPVSNKKLFKSIVEHDGLLVSIFPLLAEPVPGNFPARNRVIAGLSNGCLVVQAAQKSGALITAHYALEQGREVFAVPGPIDDPLSIGCHSLIQQGAKLVMSATDIIQEVGGVYPVVRDVQTTLYEAQQLNKQTFSEAQTKIIAACKKAASLDDILNATGLELPVVQSELFNMQLEGWVEQDFTGMWVTTRLFNI